MRAGDGPLVFSFWWLVFSCGLQVEGGLRCEGEILRLRLRMTFFVGTAHRTMRNGALAGRTESNARAGPPAGGRG
jgi:hypothetical protein